MTVRGAVVVALTQCPCIYTRAIRILCARSASEVYNLTAAQGSSATLATTTKTSIVIKKSAWVLAPSD